MISAAIVFRWSAIILALKRNKGPKQFGQSLKKGSGRLEASVQQVRRRWRKSGCRLKRSLIPGVMGKAISMMPASVRATLGGLS